MADPITNLYTYNFTTTNGNGVTNDFDFTLTATQSADDPNIYVIGNIVGTVNGIDITGLSNQGLNGRAPNLHLNFASHPVSGFDYNALSFTDAAGEIYNLSAPANGRGQLVSPDHPDSSHLILASELTGPGGSSVDISTAYTNVNYENSPSAFSVAVVPTDPICYLAGTLITTQAGDVPVEELKIGDLLPTHSGQVMPIKWIGTQIRDGRLLPKHQSPVCFKAGSLGHGLPKRDLWISSGHAIYIKGFIVNASALVNGVTVTQVRANQPIHLYQIDLGEHHCILAEGAYAETYAEWHREYFDNVDQFYQLYPDHQVTEPVHFAPRIITQDDERLPAIIDALLAYVPSEAITTDPDIHLLVDGARLDPLERNGVGRTTFNFLLPASAQSVRLVSRKNRPLALGLSSEIRELGFCLQELSAVDELGNASIHLKATHGLFEEGYYPVESNQGRWTTGNAYLPTELMLPAINSKNTEAGSGFIRLTIQGHGLARYLVVKDAIETSPATEALAAEVTASEVESELVALTPEETTPIEASNIAVLQETVIEETAIEETIQPESSHHLEAANEESPPAVAVNQ